LCPLNNCFWIRRDSIELVANLKDNGNYLCIEQYLNYEVFAPDKHENNFNQKEKHLSQQIKIAFQRLQTRFIHSIKKKQQKIRLLPKSLTINNVRFISEPI